MIAIRSLGAPEARDHQTALANLLIDCVHAGASVSFMAPLSQSEAIAFWCKVFSGLDQGDRILLAAFLNSTLVGTVQIITATPPNQPHRADVAKLLVHPSARRLGIARRLMQQVEKEARTAGKSLLVLDTCTGQAAEQLYLSLGWTSAGVIPKYALFPDGSWCDTRIFWKQIPSSVI